MSGIAGIVSFQRKLGADAANIKNMTMAQKNRGRGAQNVKITDYGAFGCASMFNDSQKEQPLSVNHFDSEHIICFDGLIYNCDELKNELKKKNIRSEFMDDSELVLNAYLCWGAGCLKYLNGIFAFSIWNTKTKELFAARDRFGIKPFYYTEKNGCLVFASEIKGLLANPEIEPVLDRNGLCEVLGLGPAMTQGSGIFCGIKEIMPAHFIVYNKNGLHTNKYWYLKSETFDSDFDECLSETQNRVFDAINMQLQEKGRNMAFFLSGGLDSSAITALAAKKYGYGVNTFSLKYAGNDDFFVPTEYQPTSDDYFIELMSDTFRTNHHVISVDNNGLVEYLTDAVDARDMPGMADVDSSLYYLCREMGSEFNGALSGECADEVFGGYPWFHRKEDFEAKVFPWAKNLEFRRNLISKEIMSADEMSDFILSAYNKSVAQTPVCPTDNAEEKRRREIAHLNLNWFMYSLGARSERIGMNCGLEIRMPFCDHKLVEYVWNIPWEFKKYREREKGLLRAVFEDVLPEEILWRKKSPFPKTHNPFYESVVKEEALRLISDNNSLVSTILDKGYIFEVANQPSDYGKPWFGQLMATPQLYAYIIQLDYWLKKYKINIKI